MPWRDMKQINRTMIVMIALAVTFGASTATTAYAKEWKLFGKSFELAYAPEEPQLDNRFEQFESEEDMHELNDAWLGMPAKSKNGEIIGFVEDAYLDEFGQVTEILVSISDENIAVYVDGSNVSLSDLDVSISLTKSQIASLEQETDFKFASR